MAKYLLQEMNDVRNTGKRTVYPKLAAKQTLSTKEFIEELYKHLRTVDRGVLSGVMCGIADTMACLMSEGYNVTLDDIGTFSMSLKFLDEKPTEIQEEGDRMLYRSAELRRRAKFERVMSGARTLKKSLYTLEQRIENALAIIDRKGYINLREYAEVNNLSRTIASSELAHISSDPSIPISFQGRPPHKVWIRTSNDSNTAGEE